MVYRLHDNSSSLLFCTLLISAILLYFIQLPIILEVFGVQGSKYLNVNRTNVQNLDVKNKSLAIATTATPTHSTAVYNTTSKTATSNISNISNGMNIIERLSDNGKYKIQLKSNESLSFLPKKGFDMQILFLSANSSSAQSSNNNTISQMKQILLPVNGFDITIYSNNGKILWQKTNQIINAATAFENVTFANDGYSGGITVQITNIKPSPVPIGTAIPLGSNNTNAITGSTANSKTPTDSVTFAASILK